MKKDIKHGNYTGKMLTALSLQKYSSSFVKYAGIQPVVS